MTVVLEETARRRELQAAHNAEHGIIPSAATRSISPLKRDRRLGDHGPDLRVSKHRQSKRGSEGAFHADQTDLLTFLEEAGYLEDDGSVKLKNLEAEMRAAAKDLRFEEAARLRDQIRKLKERSLLL
jgi:excinuclease ABC subunit B